MHGDVTVDRTEADFAADQLLETLRKYHVVDPVHSMRIYEIKRLARDLPVYEARSPQRTCTLYTLSHLVAPRKNLRSHFARMRQQLAHRLGLSHRTYKPHLPKEMNNILHETLSELLSDMHAQRP